jgi:uncharacterized protein YwqG
MLNSRKISIIHVGGFRPTGNPYASHFGLTPLALQEESWPTSESKDQEAKNLFFIYQLNLTEAPYVPEILSDIKLITIFATPDFVYADNICLRAYKDLKGLVPLDVPDDATFAKGFEVRYELACDNPSSSDSDTIYSKIGGFPDIIQDEAFEDSDDLAKPEFCLQINTEMKVGLVWGDSGSLYIARGTTKGYEDKWFFDIQFF